MTKKFNIDPNFDLFGPNLDSHIFSVDFTFTSS